VRLLDGRDAASRAFDLAHGISDERFAELAEKYPDALGSSTLSAARAGLAGAVITDPSDAERRAGITPEKAAELSAKYPDAFG